MVSRRRTGFTDLSHSQFRDLLPLRLPVNLPRLEIPFCEKLLGFYAKQHSSEWSSTQFGFNQSASKRLRTTCGGQAHRSATYVDTTEGAYVVRVVGCPELELPNRAL